MKKLALPRLTLLALLLGIGLQQANAQLYIGLHGGATVPVGFYAESRMSDNEWMFTQGHQRQAGAGTGWAAGVDFSYAMPFHSNLEIILAADFMQSGVSRDVEEYFTLRFSQRYNQCSRYEMILPRLRNIPILAGVQYRFPLTTTINLYGQALAGINLRYITPWSLSFADAEWNFPSDDESLLYNNVKVYTYAPATTFALRLGGGFFIKDIVSIGFSYNILGASPLIWDQTETVRYNVYGNLHVIKNETHVDYYDLNPTLVLISLGVRLKAFSGSRRVQDW